jgi:hypothetical protein
MLRIRVDPGVGVGVGVAGGDGVGEAGVTPGVGVGVESEEHKFTACELFRGFGLRLWKSVELLSVSVQPFAPRMSAVVVLGAGAFALSLQSAVAP